MPEVPCATGTGWDEGAPRPSRPRVSHSSPVCGEGAGWKGVEERGGRADPQRAWPLSRRRVLCRLDAVLAVRHRVTASVDPRNGACVRLMARLGLRQEARHRHSIRDGAAWPWDSHPTQSLILPLTGAPPVESELSTSPTPERIFRVLLFQGGA